MQSGSLLESSSQHICSEAPYAAAQWQPDKDALTAAGGLAVCSPAAVAPSSNWDSTDRISFRSSSTCMFASPSSSVPGMSSSSPLSEALSSPGCSGCLASAGTASERNTSLFTQHAQLDRERQTMQQTVQIRLTTAQPTATWTAFCHCKCGGLNACGQCVLNSMLLWSGVWSLSSKSASG